MEGETINIHCFINDGKKENGQSLSLSHNMDFDSFRNQVAQSLGMSVQQNSVIYNEIGGQVTNCGDVQSNDNIFYSEQGESYITPNLNLESVPNTIESLSNTVVEEPPIQQLQYAFVSKDSLPSFNLRFIIVGNASVGKSCLLLQFIDKTFSESVGPTIGVDFGSTILQIQDEIVKLQIWDTAGQEDFQAITRAYYREAAAAILVYDVTNRPSFEKLQIWLSSVQQYSTNPNLTIMLVANKTDINESKHVVTVEEGREFARLNNLLFIESSAKTGFNVDRVFVNTAYHVISQVKQGVIEVSDRNGIKRASISGAPGNVIVQGNTTTGADKKKCC